MRRTGSSFFGRSAPGIGVTLHPADVAQLIVRSPAANIRVGVALPALERRSLLFGTGCRRGLTDPTVATQLGPALATLLQGASDRLSDSLAGGLLPASVAMALVIESDTPAQAHISGFVLRYRLYRRRFSDQAPKRLFEFAGGSLSAKPLTIDVPRGSALWSAKLRMMGPFKEHDNGGAGDVRRRTWRTLAAPVAGTSDLGVELHPGETAATRMTMAQAAVIAGATVELVALAETSAGRVRLHRDAGGSPGEILGERPFPRYPQAFGALFARISIAPAVLGAGPVWVAAQCDDGALLWLTNTPGETTNGNRMVRRSARRSRMGGAERGVGSGRCGIADQLSGPDAPAGSPAFGGVRLFLGSARLRGVSPAAGSPGDRETHFDITAAVQPTIQSGTGSSVAVTLSLVSSERGRVTVYPPEIEFDP